MGAARGTRQHRRKRRQQRCYGYGTVGTVLYSLGPVLVVGPRSLAILAAAAPAALRGTSTMQLPRPPSASCQCDTEMPRRL